MDDGTSLSHFGVKGMHWGQHKAKEDLSLHPTYSQRQFANDRRTHGTKAAKQINEKLHNGVSLKQARDEAHAVTTKRHRREVALVLGAYAAYRAAPAIRHYSLKALQSVANKRVAAAGARAAAEAFSESHGIANYKTINLVFDGAKDLWG